VIVATVFVGDMQLGELVFRYGVHFTYVNSAPSGEKLTPLSMSYSNCFGVPPKTGIV
jgi:hypothetical protein